MGNIKSAITRCMKIGVAIAITLLGLATPARADPTFDPDSQDVVFRSMLDESGVLFNFNLEKYQGKRACEDLRKGEDHLDVIYDLMRDGAYSFDVANGIVAAAYVAYCVDLDSTRKGNRR
jgi:hypothetical protein